MSPIVSPPTLLRMAAKLRRFSAGFGNRLDAFFSGVWWWRARRYLAERRLGQSLERSGDTSLEARWHTEQYRRMQFAVMYWRNAPAAVRRIAQAAYDAGLPLADIRLIVLNTDLRLHKGATVLRRSSLARALSVAFATIIGLHWLLMYCLAVTAPGATWLKVLVIVGIFTVYATLYRGWSLYACRALATVDRSGPELDRIIANAPYTGMTNISPITSR